MPNHILTILLPFIFALKSISQTTYLFIGTYSTEGIFVYEFNESTGKTSFFCKTQDSVVNPSFITLSKDGNYVYACTDTRIKGQGSISSFRFDKADKKLSLINQQDCKGENPVYVSVNNENSLVVSANYFGSNVSTFSVKEGKLSSPAQVSFHEGKSINEKRQEKPHPHAAVFSPDEKLLYVPDLGTDKISIYTVDSTKGQLVSKIRDIPTETGNGPRHLVFHPHYKKAYLVEELTGTVSVHETTDDSLSLIQRIDAHNQNAKSPYGSADIHISPDGNFLYISNRGNENTIAIFSILKNGTLSSIGYEPVLGQTPRDFVISPSGNFLLVGNENSDNVVIFKRNKTTGLLTYTGNQIEVPKPACLKMIEK